MRTIRHRCRPNIRRAYEKIVRVTNSCLREICTNVRLTGAGLGFTDVLCPAQREARKKHKVANVSRGGPI